MATEKSGSATTISGVAGVVNFGENATIQVNIGHIQSISGADDTVKKQLEQLVSKLNESLQLAPPENKPDAEFLAKQTEDLVKEAGKTPPNPTALRITASGMKEAALALAAVVPSAIQIVKDITAMVLGIPR